jgi:putative FmdB family regulatory protein
MASALRLHMRPGSALKLYMVVSCARPKLASCGEGGVSDHGDERNEGCSMPRYEFMCEKCHKPFELIMTFSEREKHDVKCPKCTSSKVVPQLSGFVTQTSKKS